MYMNPTRPKRTTMGILAATYSISRPGSFDVISWTGQDCVNKKLRNGELYKDRAVSLDRARGKPE
mgnify:CR=1 FL=1